jgi:hypothetical protein
MATRKRRLQTVAINQGLIIDTAIAALIVQLAPSIANQYFFSSNPVTGQASTLVGVGAAYLYGMLMKNPNVANIGIALGAVDFVKPFIQELLPASGVGDYGLLKDYGNLQEYTNDPSKRLSLVQYQDSY